MSTNYFKETSKDQNFFTNLCVSKNQDKIFKECDKLIGKNIFVFDIETSGLPTKKNGYYKGLDEFYDATDLKKYDSCRIVSIAWAFIEECSIENLQNYQINEFLRKPIDFDNFSEESVKLHGITFDFAKKNGATLSKFFIGHFMKLIDKIDFIVGFRIEFDMMVMLSELCRLKYNNTFLKLKNIIDDKKYMCLKNMCDRSFSSKNKKYSNFKLKEFHKIMTSCDDNYTYHQAKYDVKAVIEILREILISNVNKIDALFDRNNDGDLKVISFNVFSSAVRDGKYGETFNQYNYLNNSNADMLCLQECSKSISEKLLNYESIFVRSHCGETVLCINKKHTDVGIGCVFLTDGIILINTKIKNHEVIVGSLHLAAGAGGNKKREEQLNIIQEWICKNKYEHLPIVICGDTNLRNKECYLVENTMLKSSTTETYPNKNNKYVQGQSFAKDFKVQYGYDKVLYANCENVLTEKINTNDSDHYMLKATINLSKINQSIKSNDKSTNEFAKYYMFLEECTEESETHISNAELFHEFKRWFKTSYPVDRLPNNREFVSGIKKYKNVEKSIWINGKTNTEIKYLKIKEQDEI